MKPAMGWDERDIAGSIDRLHFPIICSKKRRLQEIAHLTSTVHPQGILDITLKMTNRESFSYAKRATKFARNVFSLPGPFDHRT